MEACLEEALLWGWGRGEGQPLALPPVYLERDTAGWVRDRNGDRHHHHAQRRLFQYQLDAARLWRAEWLFISGNHRGQAICTGQEGGAGGGGAGERAPGSAWPHPTCLPPGWQRLTRVLSRHWAHVTFSASGLSPPGRELCGAGPRALLFPRPVCPQRRQSARGWLGAVLYVPCSSPPRLPLPPVGIGRGTALSTRPGSGRWGVL